MLLKKHRIGSELVHSSGILILLKNSLNFEYKQKHQTHEAKASFPVTSRILAQGIQILLYSISASVDFKF